MIDIENIVIDTVERIVTSYYPNTIVKSSKQDTPSSFPFVSIIEEDNETYQKSQDDECREHHISVMYEVNVYSNKKSGRKKEAKEIMNLVDDILQDLKFTRITKLPIENESTFRYVARYTAVIGYTLNSAYPGEHIYPSDDLYPTPNFQIYRK